ncbi:MAG: hypothetical protein OHK0026_07590 [Rhodocyclaceae bacterium]
MNRRRFLAIAMSPIAAALSGCGRQERWPEGMQPIKWDRDTCARCSMVISDRRFAAQMRGGAKNTVFKFDDPGCAVVWMRDRVSQYPWMAEEATRLWVAESNSRGRHVQWLDARTAWYVAKTSPMGYNFGAVARPQTGAVDFQTMRSHVLARGR